MTKQTAEDLRAAWDLLSPPGAWCQDVMFKRRGDEICARCVIGAINTVCRIKLNTEPSRFKVEHWRMSACIIALKRALPPNWPITMSTPAEFNDHPGRRQHEIGEWILRAAAMEEET